jgi:hypothetical protein
MNNILPGTKLIFIGYSGVLSGRPGEVYTFANWYGHNSNYWQCQELIDMGNREHNFPSSAVEVFDPNKHTNYKIMTPELLRKQEEQFIEKYGA